MFLKRPLQETLYGLVLMFYYYYDAQLERLLKGETSMLKKTLSRVLRKAYRISVVLGLRAKYHRSPIDLKIFVRDLNGKNPNVFLHLILAQDRNPEIHSAQIRFMVSISDRLMSIPM